jgi:D-3-phosphoglycerate dehydrogenase
MRIVVAEWMWEEAVGVLDRAGRVHYDPELWRRPQALRAAIAGAEALVVRNQTRVDGELLAAAPRLRVVGRLGSGLDNVDSQAAAAAGVTVVYAPGANAVATAEFTLLLALSLARKLPVAAAAARAGKWARAELVGRDLAGAVLGVLGLGRVGTLVARRARALGMEVVTAHPRLQPDDPELRDVGARLLPLEGVLRSADVVTLHLPLRPDTYHLLGRRELALMKPGALLVNTARGGLIDEEALAQALAEGWIGGAALDVREQEPPPSPDPLAALPGVLLTPHVAGLSAESQRAACRRVAEDVVAVLAGRPARHALVPAGTPRRPAAVLP